jgi:hypothetical protein
MSSLLPNIFQPVQMLCVPNDYSFTNSWIITNNGPQTLWAQVQLNDNLGLRPWSVLDPTATVSLIFQVERDTRLYGEYFPYAFGYEYPRPNPPRTFAVLGVPLTPCGGSIYSFTLTAAQVCLLVSGTVQMLYTTGTAPNIVPTVLVLNYAITKQLHLAGT